MMQILANLVSVGVRSRCLRTRLHQTGQRLCEALAHGTEINAILRTLRSRDARLNRTEIELQDFGVARLWRIRCVEHSLLFAISLYQLYLLGRTSGERQEFQGLGIDGEDTAGCAVFWRHVADGGAIRKRQRV